MYRYVGNNPINLTDPTGLCGWGNNSWSSIGGIDLGSYVNNYVQPSLGISWATPLSFYNNSPSGSNIDWYSTSGSQVLQNSFPSGQRISQSPTGASSPALGGPLLSFDDETPVETKYLYDNQNPTGYSQVLEERQDLDSDDTIEPAEVVKSYTLGLDVIAQDIAAGANAGVQYLLYDGHGSTRVLTDSNGAIAINDMGTSGNTADDVAQIFRYDAFGNAVGFNPANALTTLLYSGEQTDSTGLQYLRARYYDPASGRFNSFDTYSGDSESPQSLHKYLYCHADPIMGFDPTGTWAEFWLVTELEIAGLTLGAVPANHSDDTTQFKLRNTEAGLIYAYTTIEVTGDGKLRIHLRKGPDYDNKDWAFDKALRGNPADSDSAQIAVRWSNGIRNDNHTKIGRSGADWTEGHSEGGVESYFWDCQVERGASRVTVVMVYTDVIEGPADMPAIVAYWEGWIDKATNTWKFKTIDDKLTDNYCNWTGRKLGDINDEAKRVRGCLSDATDYNLVLRNTGRQDTGFDLQ